MPATVSEEQLCQSVLDFVVDGAYPSSEEIVAAEFPISALSRQLERIAQAREQLEVRRRTPLLRSGASKLTVGFSTERDPRPQRANRRRRRRVDFPGKTITCRH